MLVNLDKFHKTNYKDFVHKEAMIQALKFIPETFLKDVEVKTILSLTFSVDEVGENPIYITYLDKENKEHIVKLRPAINEEISERLKDYASIEYVNNQDKLNFQDSINYTEVKFNELDEKTTLTINELEERLENKIAQSYALSVQDNSVLHDTLTNYINDKTQEAKDYADTQINITRIGLKNYTDTKHEEAMTQIQEGDETTLNVAEAYTDSAFAPLDKKLSNIWGGHKATFARYTDKTDLNNLELEKLSDNSIKAILNGTDVVYWNATQSPDLSNYYTKAEITELLENIDSVFIEKIPASEMITGMLNTRNNTVNFTHLEGDFTFIYTDSSKTNLISILTNFTFTAPFTEIQEYVGQGYVFSIKVNLNEKIKGDMNLNVQFYSGDNYPSSKDEVGSILIGSGIKYSKRNYMTLQTNGYKSISETLFSSKIEVRVLG